MTLEAGLGATLAVVEESTFGVAPVMTGARGYEFDSHTLKPRKDTRQGTGLRGGALFPAASRRTVVAQDGGGEITTDLVSKGMGLWFKHCLGLASIAQVGATPAFKQTFTAAGLKGRSLAIQAGTPDSSGALQPFTFLGSKITDWAVDVVNKDLSKFKATIDAREGSTAVAYATPDYTRAAAASELAFAGAGLYLAGSGTPVIGNMAFGIKQTNAVKTDRNHTGQAGRKAEQLNNGWLSTQLTGDQEFANMVDWINRFYTDETFAVVLKFVGNVISGATTELLQITLPAVKLNNEPPSVAGTDVVTHSIECEVLDNRVDAPITIEYTSTDTTV